MKHLYIQAVDLPLAWYSVLEALYEQGEEFVIERGSELTKTKKLSLTVQVEHPESRPLLHEKAPYSMDYVEEYAGNYLFLDTKPGDESYTYGERMRKPVDQIQRVIDRYKEYKGDRQNTIVIRRPEDLNINDPPCLTVLDTEISDNRLNWVVYFRSWDGYAGFPANLAGLQILIEYMANEIGVETGTLIAHSKNIHLYQRTWELVHDILYEKSGLKTVKK